MATTFNILKSALGTAVQLATGYTTRDRSAIENKTEDAVRRTFSQQERLDNEQSYYEACLSRNEKEAVVRPGTPASISDGSGDSNILPTRRPIPEKDLITNGLMKSSSPPDWVREKQKESAKLFCEIHTELLVEPRLKEMREAGRLDNLDPKETDDVYRAIDRLSIDYGAQSVGGNFKQVQDILKKLGPRLSIVEGDLVRPVVEAVGNRGLFQSIGAIFSRLAAYIGMIFEAQKNSMWTSI